MTTRALALVALLAGLAGLLALRPAPQDADRAPRFEAWDVFVDSGTSPLAAWQVHFAVRGGGARIVGVEGGEHPAFADAPFYDPAALQGGRIVVAAFSTADALPRGRARIARIHLVVDAGAEPRFDVALEARHPPPARRRRRLRPRRLDRGTCPRARRGSPRLRRRAALQPGQR